VQSRIGQILTQMGYQIAIDLDGHQAVQMPQQRTRQGAPSRANLNNGGLTTIRCGQLCDEFQRLLINEKVLAKAFTGARQRAGAPGR